MANCDSRILQSWNPTLNGTFSSFKFEAITYQMIDTNCDGKADTYKKISAPLSDKDPNQKSRTETFSIFGDGAQLNQGQVEEMFNSLELKKKSAPTGDCFPPKKGG
jgi:hypothetical protein